ncbi:MAG: SBBP repeat-containing protein [Acidobacteriota bacterium]
MNKSRRTSALLQLGLAILAVHFLTLTDARAQPSLEYATYFHHYAMSNGRYRNSNIGIVAPAPDGSTYITGSGDDWHESTLWLRRLSPDGQRMMTDIPLFRGDALDIALTPSGKVVFAGRTAHDTLPIVGGFQTELGQAPLPLSHHTPSTGDAFVAVYDATGSTLHYSTFLGGSELDQATALALDDHGTLVLVGHTQSDDFPLVAAAHSVPGEDIDRTGDAFVARIASDGDLDFATYLGGAGYDVATGVVLDDEGNTWVIGTTYSRDFPTLGPQLESRLPSCPVGEDCPADVFIAGLSPEGVLLHSTLIGGSGRDVGVDVALTPQGELIVVGETSSMDFPVHAPLQSPPDAERSGFVLKLDTTTLSLSYATHLGGPAELAELYHGTVVTAVDTDEEGRAYLVGATSSTSFPTVSAFQTSYAGGEVDGFVSILSADGSALEFSSYLGGGVQASCELLSCPREDATDWPLSIQVGEGGVLHVGGFTTSADFPTVDPLRPEHPPFISLAGFLARLMTDPTVLLEPNGLRLSLSGRAIVLGWDETMGDPKYALHVGSLASLIQTREYDHVRQEPCEITAPPFSIGLGDLPPGDSYFLVTSVRDADESSYGRNSRGIERPTGVSCP